MRLLVTGPMGASKASFIQSVTNMDLPDTEHLQVNDMTLVKPRTMVSEDFGQLSLGPDCALHIYGTPGQLQGTFPWNKLLQNSHAYILLVSANRPGEFRHARLIHRFIREHVALPMVVGLTHTDCVRAWDAENMALVLGFTDQMDCPPVLKVNLDDPTSVTDALMILVTQCWKASNFQNKSG